jgi:K+ transporter
VLGFRSSSNLAAAYGIAISGTMAITAVLAGIVARSHWERPPALAAAVFGAFLAVDLTFFRAHALKIAAGGWFPVVMAAAVFVLMSTWRRGREVMFERLYRDARLPDPSWDTSFFLSRATYLPSARPDLPRWREQMFIKLANTALDATRFFRLPPDRVVEVGSQVEI